MKTIDKKIGMGSREELSLGDKILAWGFVTFYILSIAVPIGALVNKYNKKMHRNGFHYDLRYKAFKERTKENTYFWRED